MMNEQNKAEDHIAQNSANTSRPAWSDPVLSRIEIKRTMFGHSTGIDLSGQISS